MFNDGIEAVSKTAKKKAKLLSANPAGYMVSSMIAGMFVGFAVLLSYTVGGQLAGSAFTKPMMGASFGIALSLVTMAGGELFTGNVLAMVIGWIQKTVTTKQVIKVLVASFLGNWIGSIILAFLFVGTGLDIGPVGEFMAHGAMDKMHGSAVELLCKAILCNTLVCLGMWCYYKMKSESGKLIMLFWCLYAFITMGFQHCVANMTLLSVSLIHPVDVLVSIEGYFYNIGIVTIGNIIGAIIFVALPYSLIAMRNIESE